MLEKINRALEGIGSFASSLYRKISIFLVIALFFLTPLAFDLYSSESYWWWNLLVLGFVFLPFLVWLFIWMVIGQLRDAPQHGFSLIQDIDKVSTDLKDTELNQINGFRGVLRTINQFRKHEGLETLFDTVSGIGLLCNPVFLVFSLLLLLLLLLLMLVTPLILII